MPNYSGSLGVGGAHRSRCLTSYAHGRAVRNGGDNEIDRKVHYVEKCCCCGKKLSKEEKQQSHTWCEKHQKMFKHWEIGKLKDENN